MLGRWARDCFGAACDHHEEHPKAHAGRAYMGAEEAPTSLPSVVSSGLPCTRPWGCCALASPSLQCRYARPSWMNGPQRPPIMDGWQRPPRWTGGLPESAQVAAQPRVRTPLLSVRTARRGKGAPEPPLPPRQAPRPKKGGACGTLPLRGRNGALRPPPCGPRRPPRRHRPPCVAVALVSGRPSTPCAPHLGNAGAGAGPAPPHGG